MTSSSLVKREDRNSPKKIKIIDPKNIIMNPILSEVV